MLLSRVVLLVITMIRANTTLYIITSQNPHVIRLLMCAFVLNLPEHKVPVVSPDVGGGFGSKICPTFPCLTVDYEAGIQHQLEPVRNN